MRADFASKKTEGERRKGRGEKEKRGKDRWKTLISKLYAVLIRISVETVAGCGQLPPEI